MEIDFKMWSRVQGRMEEERPTDCGIIVQCMDNNE